MDKPFSSEARSEFEKFLASALPARLRAQRMGEMAKVLTATTLGDDDEYTGIIAWNRDTKGLDLVVTVENEDTGWVPVTLCGVVFAAYSVTGEVVAISEEEASIMADDILKNWLELVSPHLDFLKVVKLYDFTLLDFSLPPEASITRVTGAIGLSVST